MIQRLPNLIPFLCHVWNVQKQAKMAKSAYVIGKIQIKLTNSLANAEKLP